MSRSKPQAQRPSTTRCAVYTRKSTDEGLEQSFNSLDAQREACQAYILSQRHEGWALVRDSYDDGGFSGGNMDRPGLHRLLEDVKAGRIDVIVVYKVDRLTRSLADFAKIVEILDERDASFVSVTQSFNTTTSMGRLTLNVLLSFAQFEREVTGERIRDKIAASKAKGMWMGGTVPLGYDVIDRKLVVNEAEAERVRHIFQRYVDIGCGRALRDELNATGYRTKNGNLFGRGSLFGLLKNRTYRGEISHRGTIHQGEHDALITPELWDAAEQLRSEQSVERRRANARHPSLLAGILFDGEGRRMSPSHAVKSGKRYRYYCTHDDGCPPGAPAPWRIPADEIETAVIRLVQALLRDRSRVMSIVGTSSAALLGSALTKTYELGQSLDNPIERRAVIVDLEPAVHLGEDHIEIRMSAAAIADVLGVKPDMYEHSEELIIARAPAIKARRGNETKLIIANDNGRADRIKDKRLIDLIVEARQTYKLVIDSPDVPIRRLVRQQGKCRKRFYKLLHISMLAPDIVLACAEGTQPVRLTAASLLDADLPMRWQDQRELLGFT